MNDRLPTYDDIFRERGEALNACLVLAGERDRLRAENAALRELVREAYEEADLGWLGTNWDKRAEKALGN